jgi:hypothetical protein
MESFQGQIDITRQYIIGQLKQEVSELQMKLSNTGDKRVSDVWDKQLYSKVITRKNRLIETLS